MEIVIILFVLVGGSIAISAWKNKDSKTSLQTEKDIGENVCHIRECSACGHKGKMKTWIANYNVPKCILVLGFLLGYVPGLIFLVIYWGKYLCPSCGAIGNNRVMIDNQLGQ